MNSDQAPDRISRRRMLNRMGAGAAVVWTAPVVTSLQAPAFAAPSLACPETGCSSCVDVGGSCQGGPPGCFKGLSTEGECLCFVNAICSGLTPCRSSSECSPGWHCLCPQNGCGMSVCVPCCFFPAPGSPPKGAATVAGR
jgi:hypothetical protein